MDKLQFSVPTLFGLEGPCADELRRLGLERVGGVEFYPPMELNR